VQSLPRAAGEITAVALREVDGWLFKIGAQFLIIKKKE